MKRSLFRLVFSLSLLGTTVCLFAANKPAQESYESSIEAVVRNKYYYKTGHIELGLTAGAMPYDSLVTHYLVGGRALWHFTDHFGWEILDFQYAFPSVTSYTTNTIVKANGISHLETVKIKQMVGTSFLLSPLYGKIRFIGRQVLYFDIYTVLGGGAANTEVLNIHSSGVGGPAETDTLKSGWDAMFNFGFGFKVFLNDAMGLVVDLRDYVVYSRTYGNYALKSNFSVFAGLSFFIPPI